MTTVENKPKSEHTCGEPCEVWSRVTGYFRPVSSWNRGKKQEFKDRKTFELNKEKCC